MDEDGHDFTQPIIPDFFKQTDEYIQNVDLNLTTSAPPPLSPNPNITSLHLPEKLPQQPLRNPKFWLQNALHHSQNLPLPSPLSLSIPSIRLNLLRRIRHLHGTNGPGITLYKVT